MQVGRRSGITFSSFALRASWRSRCRNSRTTAHISTSTARCSLIYVRFGPLTHLARTQARLAHPYRPTDLAASFFDDQPCESMYLKVPYLRPSSVSEAIGNSRRPFPVPCGVITSHSMPFSSIATSAPSLAVRNIVVALPRSRHIAARSEAGFAIIELRSRSHRSSRGRLSRVAARIL